jgi:hypothetical protein
MSCYIFAATALALGSVLSAAIVIAWAIATDEKYMNNVWRDEDELRRK